MNPDTYPVVADKVLFGCLGVAKVRRALMF